MTRPTPNTNGPRHLTTIASGVPQQLPASGLLATESELMDEAGELSLKRCKFGAEEKYLHCKVFQGSHDGNRLQDVHFPNFFLVLAFQFGSKRRAGGVLILF